MPIILGHVYRIYLWQYTDITYDAKFAEKKDNLTQGKTK